MSLRTWFQQFCDRLAWKPAKPRRRTPSPRLATRVLVPEERILMFGLTDDAYAMEMNAVPAHVLVLANDNPSSGPLEITSFSQPTTGGTVSLLDNPSGPGTDQLVFTVDPEYTGNIVFTYTAQDATSSQATANVNVAVTARPVITNLRLTHDTETLGDLNTSDGRLSFTLTDADPGVSYDLQFDINGDGVSDFGRSVSATGVYEQNLSNELGYGSQTVAVRAIEHPVSGPSVAGDWTSLSFTRSHFASIATATEVDIYQVVLAAGDKLSISVSTPGDLDSHLRLFDALGMEVLSNSNSIDPLTGQISTDSRLEFRAIFAGTYLIGVSSVGNEYYSATNPNPNTGGSGSGSGSSSGSDSSGSGSSGSGSGYSTSGYSTGSGISGYWSGSAAPGSTGDYVLSIQVDANHAPVTVNDTLAASGSLVVHASVLTNDSDPEGDSFQLVSVTGAQHGQATISVSTGSGSGSGSGSSNGSYSDPSYYYLGSSSSLLNQIDYTPTPGFEGTEVLTYTVQDVYGQQSTGTLTVTVTNNGVVVANAVVANTPPTIGNLTLSNPTVMSGTVYGDFVGSLADSTPSSSYTIEIDTNGDQITDVSGMAVGTGSFTFSGSLPVGSTTITARVMESVSATSPPVSGNWQTITLSETGSASGSTSASSSGSGSSTGSSSTSSSSGGTSTAPPVWTMANGSVLDTTAADSAFSTAVLGALGSYDSLMQAAADGRTADDLLAWTTFTGLMDTANATWTSTNATSLANHTTSLEDADQQLEDDDAADWNTYWDQIDVFQGDYDTEVDRAKLALTVAYAGADATRLADDLDSADTLIGVMDGADTVYEGTELLELAARWLAWTGADLVYTAAEYAAMAEMSSAYMAFQADPSSYGDGNWTTLNVEYDLQYNSDKAAAEGVFSGALSAAQADYDTAKADALDEFDLWEAFAYADYTAALDTNETAYQDAFSLATIGYWTEAATHATTAATAIADAEFWRDLSLFLVDETYDSAVADLALTRASEHDTHLASYNTDEAAAWLQLQSDLTSSAQTHTSDIAAAKAEGEVALDAAWDAYDLVANDPLSTASQKDIALAARLIAVAAALAKYNNDIATADARQTDDDVDSWAVYDIDVNGFLTTYWNAEALSDSDQTHLVNEAYVIWANDTQAAWAGYSNDVADARGQQTLDDAQSANDAWHDIHLATLIWYSDNAVAGNDYLDAVIPLESDYYSSMESAWVDYSVATNNAHATKTISIADARAATVRRWADGMAGTYPGIYAEYLADMEEATAARTETQELASAGYANAMVAAGAVWAETVIPAWVAYVDEVSDHTVSWVDTSSLAWETTQNDIADAGLDYTIAAVPVGTQLTEDLNQNFSDWVSNVATADETYSNDLADHAVTWVEAATAAGEGLGNDTIINATTYVHLATGLDVLLAGAIGEAVINWAGTVAGQLTGTPYTPPPSTIPEQTTGATGPTGTTGPVGQQQQTPQQPFTLVPNDGDRDVVFVYDSTETGRLRDGFFQAANDYAHRTGQPDWNSTIGWLEEYVRQGGLIDELYIADHGHYGTLGLSQQFGKSFLTETQIQQLTPLLGPNAVIIFCGCQVGQGAGFCQMVANTTSSTVLAGTGDNYWPEMNRFGLILGTQGYADFYNGGVWQTFTPPGESATATPGGLGLRGTNSGINCPRVNKGKP